MRRLLQVIALVSLLGASSAEAATTWQPGEALGPENSWVVGAVVTSDDEFVALMSDSENTFGVSQPPGGGSQRLQALASGPAHRYDVATGGGVTVAIWGTGNDAIVTRRLPGEMFGAPLAIGSYTDGPVAAAVNAHGAAIVAWPSSVDGQDTRQAAFSLPGGGWSNPLPAPLGLPILRPDGEAVFVGARENQLIASLMRPDGAVTEVVLGTTSHAQVLATEPVVDGSSRVAVGWSKGDPPPLYDRAVHDLHVTTLDGAGGLRTIDLGRGYTPQVTTNSSGQALAVWEAPQPDSTGYVYMAPIAMRLNLATSAADAPERLRHGNSIIPAISENGDIMAATSHYDVFATRARPGGLMRATQSVGCFARGAYPSFAGIDSRGQGILVIGNLVVRDTPANTWGRNWCSYDPHASIPAYHPVGEYRRADFPVTIMMQAASDPEATSQTYRWDLDDDGTYETDTGEKDRLARHWPAGRHWFGVEQTRFFGDVSSERVAWRFEFEVYPSWATAAIPLLRPPQLMLGHRSLRKALRGGIRATVRSPASGPATLEVRRRLPRGGSMVLARRRPRLVANRPETLAIPFKRSVKRRLRRVRTLPIEVRLLQQGKRLARKRTTLR